ncbi:MAG: hypothetical protein ACNA7W_22165 [Pseudomonadales bacterium]
MGFDKYVEGFLASNAYGAPREILEKLRARYDIVGPFDMATCFRFGGIPFEEARASLELFVREVLPEVRSWQ